MQKPRCERCAFRVTVEIRQMGQIRILTDRVANQIAAGEVVERPASVFKELIENALDAGADKIRAELRTGGRVLIRIADDGCGMGRDDALLAFERHATSKLRRSKDLLSIATLGFRGEALPSIASVSRVTLKTRARGDDSGTVVEIHGGRLRDVRDEAMPPGTSVSVRSLFFNVPARRKFLRTEQTELSHVLRTATHYSLANTDKTIHLTNERGSLLHVTPVNTLRERVYQIFGADTLGRLVEIGPAGGRSPGDARPDTTGSVPLRLTGFVSEPQLQRSNRNSYHIFVNGRAVRDSLIHRAVGRAYENLVPSGAYPFVLLFLEIDPHSVDVNVHPAKTEVRFRQPGRVFDFIRDSIRDRLVEAKPAADLPASGVSKQYAPTDGGVPQPGSSLPPPVGSLLPRRRGGHTGRFRLPASGPSAVAPAVPDGPRSAEPSPAHQGEAALCNGRDPLVDARPDNLGSLSGLRLLGQIHDSFIVAEGDDAVWIIDQHVAHERILFEQVLAARLRGRPTVQRLLVPITVTLTPAQLAVSARIEDELVGSGFEIDRSGERSLTVRAVPAELSPQQVETLLPELLDGASEQSGGLTLGDLRRRMAATIACHAAIKVNTRLTVEKMRWLLEGLANSDCPMACPHGRPIALKYGMREILKAFHRV
ncbi:MAG: DNA mismatch repair endonuclease MutL [Bryobacterales bacterium]|nr:DNA mismatch repair endonuclease MutL [Bryobacterales bacterium]